MVATDAGGRFERERVAAVARWPLRALAEVLVTGRSEPRFPSARPVWWHRLRLPLIANVTAAVLLWLHGVSSLTSAMDGGLAGAAPVAALLPSVALLIRDRWPLGAWRLATFAAVATALLAWPTPVMLQSASVFLVCCYVVATRNTSTVTGGALMVTVLGFVVIDATVPSPPESFVIIALLGPAAALLLGANVRGGRRAHAERLANAARSAQEQAARATAEERTRIARELHDVVAHHMSVIAIQSEAAPMRHRADPEGLTSELGEIRRAARAALAETRRILAVLRDASPEDVHAPQPTLAVVGELVANARAAGHRIQLTTVGTHRTLPAGVELSAYRIVQESLSNVLRHAPGADVHVTIGYEPACLQIRVTNGPVSRRTATDDARPVPDGGSHGLVGMRERAAMLSGSMTAAPTPDGGFEVAATLPVEAT